MTFDLTTWKQSTADRLRGLGAWLKDRRQDAPYAAYGTLCGMSLWPLVEAARRGQTLDVMVALGAVAGGVGGNLLANQIQAWKDRADAGASETDAIAAEWIARAAPGNADLREALDAVLDKLDAVSAAQAALGQTARQAFTQALRNDLQRLGSLPRFEAQLKGGGAIAQGQGARAVGARGVLVDGSVTSPIVTGDHNTVTTGGVNVGGNVSTGGGDFVGRDKVVHNYLGGADLDGAGAGLVSTAEGRRLVKLLDGYFALDDVEGLCFELGIDAENLRGATKVGKARALVAQCEATGQLPNLKQLMRVARPNLRDQLH